jgi:hypothetical protein
MFKLSFSRTFSSISSQSGRNSKNYYQGHVRQIELLILEKWHLWLSFKISYIKTSKKTVFRDIRLNCSPKIEKTEHQGTKIQIFPGVLKAQKTRMTQFFSEFFVVFFKYFCSLKHNWLIWRVHIENLICRKNIFWSENRQLDFCFFSISSHDMFFQKIIF